MFSSVWQTLHPECLCEFPIKETKHLYVGRQAQKHQSRFRTDRPAEDMSHTVLGRSVLINDTRVVLAAPLPSCMRDLVILTLTNPK